MRELMARGGMRIGEVLKLRFKDLQDCKLILQQPKSGREHECVFIPQKVAGRLNMPLKSARAQRIGFSRFHMKVPG